MPTSLVHDSQNNLILLGTTSSTNYPFTTGAYNTSFNGGWASTQANMWGSVFANGTDIVITKLDNIGALINSTYVGGTDNEGLNESIVYNYSDQARGEIFVDTNDDVYVTSSLWSCDFPVTNGSEINNGTGGSGCFLAQDAVVFKMNSTLSSITWSTYLGGSDYEAGYSIRVSNQGKVFVCGGTNSTDLGTTPGVVNPNKSGAAGSSYADLDGFIAVFDATTGLSLARTYLGTSSYDQTFIIEVDSLEDVYVVGQTTGSYPVVNAAYSNANGRQFIHKLNSGLTSTYYSTIFGSGSSSVDISPTAFLVDNCGNVYVSGWGGGYNNSSTTYAYNPQAGGNMSGMPFTANAQQSTTDGNDFYFFVLERDATGLLYGTYLGDPVSYEHTDGGTSRFDPEGIVYQSVCASCGSGSFPTTPGVYSSANPSGRICNMGAIKFEFDFQGVEADAVQPGNITLCSSPYIVNFSAGATPPSQAFWDFGDGNTSSTVNPSHTYADTGTYQIMYVAIEPSSCNYSDTSYFSVNLIAAQQFSAQLNIPPPNPCDDTMFVNLQFTGTGADSIVWDMGDGTIIINDTLFSYYYTVPGSYTVTMTAWDFICNNTGTVTQTLNFNPTYSYANATAPPNVMLCDPPFDVTFNSTSGTPHVFWDFGDGNSSTLANLTHTYADTGTYQVMYIAIDSTTCNIADTAYFTVDLDQAEQFSATMNIQPPDPCEDSMLVSLAFTGTGADSIIWDMGDGTVFYDTSSVDYYYTVQGTYIISMIAYDLTCNHIDTVTDTAVFISNFSYANATAPPNVMLCDPPFDVDFYSSSGTPHVFWDFGDGVGTSNLDSLTYTYADTGTYQVMYIAIDSSTCNIADTAYFTVDLDQAEQLSAEFDIPVIDPCTDTSQMLVELLFTGTAADSIVWDMGDGTVFYDSTSISYLYTTQGIYIISMTAWDFTCNNIDTLIDTVEFHVSYSLANANASPNILACDPPYDVTFNSGAPSPPYSFWDFADGDTSILHNPMHTFTDTGYYNIMYIATDSTTCNISDTVYLSVEIRLSENFSAELDFVPPPPCGSDSMLVEMAFTGSGADSLIWDMGNGILFNDSALSYYYTVPGYYTVSLTAFDTLCNKVETIDETVYYAGNFQSEYIVPNIFTPNGDGENDRLVFINANDTKEFSISIFNRWGGLVYQSDNANIAWDGRSPAGKEENEGIFYFELKYTVSEMLQVVESVAIYIIL